MKFRTTASLQSGQREAPFVERNPMEAKEAILTRRSIRAYTDQPVNDED